MTVASCILFSDTCGVDLMDVVTQVGNDVTANTTMWIGAWGGNGGNVDKAKAGGAGGYAQTTTSVSKLMAMNNGSSEIFYFLADAGAGGGNHCGAGGGSATIVTFEDLTLNPSENPTDSSPPILLVAGGAGGGGGGGGHGNASFASFGGAGGGSFAIKSELSTGLAPTNFVGNACGTSTGCVEINFCLTIACENQ